MPDLATLLLPYQRRWISAAAPFAVAEKSRRIGWTWASAYRAVMRRLKLETNLYFTSADLTAAREFVEYCQHWARVFNAGAGGLREEFIDEAGGGMTAFVMRFANGSKIVAGSSNPKFFRSKGGDADADEFAFHSDPRELLKAMHATAMVWGHQLRVWSTHNGEGSFFQRLVRDAAPGSASFDVGRSMLDVRRSEAGKNEHRTSNAEHRTSNVGARVEVHRVTILDAVEQGLVERIKGLKAPNPTARRDWLEDLRASVPDQDTWNEEYLCQPASGNSALLSYELIAACEAEGSGFRGEGSGSRGQGSTEGAASEPSFLNPEPRTLTPLYAGFDVGRKHDRSVLWVLEKVGDVYWTRTVRVLEQTPFTDQENVLHALMQGRAVRRLCIDSTGIGAMLAERLVQRWGHRVEAVHFSAPVKSDLAMPLVRLFQDRRVRVPNDPETREDLHRVRRSVTTSGNVRFDAERTDDGHADRFWALALAYHAAEDGKLRLPQPLMRKPVGW